VRALNETVEVVKGKKGGNIKKKNKKSTLGVEGREKPLFWKVRTQLAGGP